MVQPYQTLLAINGVTIPEASARGVSQTLEPIPQAGNFRRTVNMELKNIAPPDARGKYRTSISCEDINAPFWDDLFPGLQVQIDCISELYYLVGGSAIKPVVSGSERTVGNVVFYRPSLTMIITSINSDDNEYEARRSWTFEAEEI